MLSKNPEVGFIGFGELAYIFSLGLKAAGIKQILAYDKAASDPTCKEIINKRASDANVQLVLSLQELMKRSELVFSSVWGNLSLQITKESAQFIQPDRMYADLNNSTPTAKLQGAEIINAKGAKFVDIAIFGTPSKEGHKAPMCVSGDGAEQFKLVMSEYGMDIELMSGGAGRATTMKTLAKIYYLGVQALHLELAISARKAGCDIKFLPHLLVKPTVKVPREDEMAFWAIRGGLRAERKTAELRAYIEAIKEWGIEPIMMQAALKRFDLTAQYKLQEYFKAEDPPLTEFEAMIETMEKIGTERNIGLK